MPRSWLTQSVAGSGGTKTTTSRCEGTSLDSDHKQFVCHTHLAPKGYAAQSTVRAFAHAYLREMLSLR